MMRHMTHVLGVACDVSRATHADVLPTTSPLVSFRFVSFPFGGAGRDHITNSFSTDDEGLFPSVNSV
jgi:hypothetical protein